jgi:hypothetical protein
MVDIQKLKDKFFTDPDWSVMEELLREYITPLESALNIDATWSNDQIATEVRGRQLAYNSIDKFLVDAGVLKPRIINDKPSFK